VTISITSPITGSAQTGQSSPSFTNVVDQAPDVNAKQVYVTVAAGNASNRIHSASDPFTLAYWREKIIKILPAIGLNGQYASVPVNKYKQITRKGVIVAANEPPRVMIVRTEIECPAGAESFDFPNVTAGISAHIGLLTQQSAGFGDTVKSGSL
jgi:hypothetical protein